MNAVAENDQIVAAPVKATNSQLHTVDELHQQCRFNDAIIFLHGREGSGKTTISELFLEQASEYAEVALVSASERSHPDRIRAQILTQLFGTIRITDESLTRQIGQQQPLPHIIVVIDNADSLADAMIAECISTMAQLNAVGRKISIVLVADSRWAIQQKPAPEVRAQGPVMVEVGPLTAQEQLTFVRRLLPEKQKPFWSADKLDQFLRTINGYPGEIQQRLQLSLATQAQRYREPEPEASAEPNVVFHKQGKRQAQPRSAGKRRNPLALILMASILLTSAVVAYLIRDQWYPDLQQLLTRSETVAEPEQNTSAPAAAEQTSQQAATKNAEEAATQPAATSATEQFQPVDFTLQPKELAVSYNQALSSLNREAAKENDPRDVQVALVKTPQEAKPVSSEKPAPTKPKQQPKPASKPAELFDSAWVQQQPASHYTLQISLVSSTELLKNFLADNDLTEITKVYPEQRNGQRRYVVIYGSYPSIEAARAAVNALPAGVQAMQPWAKSFATVQEELTSVLTP